MAWFEAHQSMPRHRKTLKLAAELNISRREAIGLMWDLWAWGLDNADINGRLKGLTAQDIADAMDYPRKKGAQLIAAFIASGYIEMTEDNEYVLHDWKDYAGKLNEKKERDKARKRGGNPTEIQRNSNGIPTEFQRKSDGNPTEIQRNSDGIPALPNLTLPNLTNLDDDEDEEDEGVIHTRACVREDQHSEIVSQARAAYRRAFGREPTVTEAEQLAIAAECVGKVSLLSDAIEVAAMHGAKSVVSYVHSIMREWADQMIDTPDELAEYQYLRDCATGRITTGLAATEAMDRIREIREAKQRGVLE